MFARLGPARMMKSNLSLVFVFIKVKSDSRTHPVALSFNHLPFEFRRSGTHYDLRPPQVSRTEIQLVNGAGSPTVESDHHSLTPSGVEIASNTRSGEALIWKSCKMSAMKIASVLIDDLPGVSNIGTGSGDPVA